MRVLGKAIVLLVALGLAWPAWGAWDQDDVQKLVGKISEGKGFHEAGDHPDALEQIVLFRVGEVAPSFAYVIDLKARLCFALAGKDTALQLVPCERIKAGYPLFAPLITWAD